MRELEIRQLKAMAVGSRQEDHYTVRLHLFDADGNIIEIFEQDHPESKPFIKAAHELIGLPVSRVHYGAPQSVLNWMNHLSTEDSEELWQWLDETPDAIHQLIELAASKAEDGR